MSTTGPNSPATTATASYIPSGGSTPGTTWTDYGNVVASDDAKASVNAAVNYGGRYYSGAIDATNFGFSIPETDVINGIVVEVERSAASTFAIRWELAQLIQGGTAGGTTNNGAGGFFPTTDAYQTLGSSVTLWGLTWTAADINASNFGIKLVVQKDGDGAINAYIDHVRITVYHSEAPATLLQAPPRFLEAIRRASFY